MDASFSNPPAPAPQPAPAYPQGTPPLGHSATLPLSAQEESLFKSAARWAGDPMELAEILSLPYSELLAWLAEPRIEALLAQHDAFLARTQANRARAASTRIADALTKDFDETEDPKERRRIAGPLL